MTIEIVRKSPHVVGGSIVEDRPHLFRNLPKRYPQGYYQLVHPRWAEGHNLVCNATLVGHLDEAAELVERGYRIRMSEGGCGSSPDLVKSEQLIVRRT
jgi:hypothetical protein